MFTEADAADAADAVLWGQGPSRELPPELDDKQKRQEELHKTLKKLQEADAARKKNGIDPKKNPAQLPKADTDSKVMPNKEGGYAPNYTPTATPDSTARFRTDDSGDTNRLWKNKSWCMSPNQPQSVRVPGIPSEKW